MCDDRRAVEAGTRGAELLASANADDPWRALEVFEAEQRALSEGAAGFGEQWDEPTVKTLRDFLLVGDAHLVRSLAEEGRLAKLLGIRRHHVGVAPGFDRSVSGFKRSRHGDAVVVWAPDVPARELAVPAFALRELRCPVVVVCREGEIPESGAIFVTRARAGKHLRRAAVVVDASIGSAASAIAIARYGIPLAVTSTSGAGGFLDGVFVYDPWASRSLLRAVTAAMAGEPPRLRAANPSIGELRALLKSTVSSTSRGPLVSIIVPTYNRRELLPDALRVLERQTYRNIEIVVVNDGGENVRDIVAKSPKARLIERKTNAGIAQAINDGIRAAKGVYVGFLADDDELFPDHIARLVEALRRSGASVAHGNAVNRLLEDDGRGGSRVYGYLINYDGFLDRTEMQWCMNMILFSCLFHRKVMVQTGGLNPDFKVANDYEFTCRVSSRHDFVHVDYVTCAYNYRAGAQTLSNRGHQLIDEVVMVYERTPAADRPLVEEKRRITLEILEAGLKRGDYWPAPIRLEEER